MSSSYLFLYLILVYDSLKKKKKRKETYHQRRVWVDIYVNFKWTQHCSEEAKQEVERQTTLDFLLFIQGWGGRNGHIRRAQWKYWCDAGICLLCVQEFRTSRVFHFSSPLDEGDRQYLISKTKSFFVSIHALSDVHDEYVN